MNGGGGVFSFYKIMRDIFTLTHNISFPGEFCFYLSLSYVSLQCVIFLLKVTQHDYKTATIYSALHYLVLRCVFVPCYFPPVQSTVSSEGLKMTENNI